MKRFVSHISNKELDRDLEFNYFGARYYQPEFPRFLSPDPVGGTPGVFISWNRYLYCRNDPINRIDPDGLNTVAIISFSETFGINFGVHVGLYFDNPAAGQQGFYGPYFYDPSGTYMEYEGDIGTGRLWAKYQLGGTLEDYIDYHTADGDTVLTHTFNTTPEEESLMIRRANDMPAATPGSLNCAFYSSCVLSGIGPFQDLVITRFPGILYKRLKEIKVRLLKDQAKKRIQDLIDSGIIMPTNSNNSSSGD